MKIKVFITIFYFFILTFAAQTGELGHFDCNFTKEINIPFSYSDNQTAVVPILNQVVFYSYYDQFTFWYKITLKQNEVLNFKVTAMNDSDSYLIYVYQYNGADFCNKIYTRKIKPYLSSWYVGLGAETKKPINKIIKAKKDQVYYISVVNTSMNNCGHHFQLSYQTKDTLMVKALHLPCKTDTSSLSLTKISSKIDNKDIRINKPLSIPTKKDTIKQTNTAINAISLPIKTVTSSTNTQPISEIKLNKETTPNIFTCIVKDSKKLIPINANVTLLDMDTKELIVLSNPLTGRWEASLNQNHNYFIKCSAIGYNEIQKVIDFSNETAIELLLKPLGANDNFVMKSIYFHPSTYALKNESINDLEGLLQFLISHPNTVIEIQGHTNGDNKVVKNKAYVNLGVEWNFQGSSKKLSVKRAEAIRNYLILNGISAKRLIAKGYGGSKAIVKNPETIEEGRRNIRVEVLILKV